MCATLRNSSPLKCCSRRERRLVSSSSALLYALPHDRL
jgi:hypothetical protein